MLLSGGSGVLKIGLVWYERVRGGANFVARITVYSAGAQVGTKKTNRSTNSLRISLMVWHRSIAPSGRVLKGNSGVDKRNYLHFTGDMGIRWI